MHFVIIYTEKKLSRVFVVVKIIYLLKALTSGLK